MVTEADKYHRTFMNTTSAPTVNLNWYSSKLVEQEQISTSC